MKKLSWLLISVFASFLAVSGSAFAYLDPGTGAAIVGSIIPLVLAVASAILAFLIKYFWRPIKTFFSKIFGKKDSSASKPAGEQASKPEENSIPATRNPEPATQSSNPEVAPTTPSNGQ